MDKRTISKENIEKILKFLEFDKAKSENKTTIVEKEKKHTKNDTE